MLTKEEKKDYILKHKKDIQELCNASVRESNEVLKKVNDMENKFNLKMYKEMKKKHPEEKIKKPKIVKTKLDRIQKISNSYIKSLYLAPNIAHKEEMQGIDLKPYLKEIRKRKIEYELVLLIRDKKVVKKYLYTGHNKAGVPISKFNDEIIKNARRYKADVYIAHNHPVLVVATPSMSDISCYKHIYKQYKEKGVNIIDFAVVTFDDYYSYEKQKREVNKILKIAKADGIKDEFILDLIEYTFIARNKKYMYKRKKLHPNYPYDSKKSERIKAITNKKYKMIKLKARKEFNKIIKKYPQYAF